MPEAPQPCWPAEATPLLARYWQISRRMSRQLTRSLEDLNGETEPTEPMRRWWRDRY
jgi:hypothetical protein